METRRSTTAKRLVMLAVGITVIVAFALGGWLRQYARHSRIRDLSGAVLRVGEGTVVAPVSREGGQEGRTTRPWALLRIEGKLATAEDLPWNVDLREGQKVPVHYMIGRSGRAYVVRVLLPASAP